MIRSCDAVQYKQLDGTPSFPLPMVACDWWWLQFTHGSFAARRFLMTRNATAEIKVDGSIVYLGHETKPMSGNHLF